MEVRQGLFFQLLLLFVAGNRGYGLTGFLRTVGFQRPVTRLVAVQKGPLSLALEPTAVAAVVLLVSLPFTGNEKPVHKVYKRDSDVARQDVTHPQGQWTRQVLQFHAGRGEGSRKVFYNFIHTQNSFLTFVRPTEIMCALEVFLITYLQMSHHTPLSYPMSHQKSTHTWFYLTIQLNFLQ